MEQADTLKILESQAREFQDLCTEVNNLINKKKE